MLLLFQTSLGSAKETESTKVRVKAREGWRDREENSVMGKEKTQKANSNEKLVVSKK